jgi:hypothetical protein
MSIRWLVVAGAAALLSACGGNVLVEKDGEGGGGSGGSEGGGGATGTTGTSVPPGDVTPACLDYCASVVESKSCFGLEECHGRCMSFYIPGCAAEVEVMLGCLPEWLNEACQITYADDPSDGCTPAVDAMWSCASQAAPSCMGTEAEIVPETGCKGSSTCSSLKFEVNCEDDAVCTCRQNGIEVGSCSMPFTGTEPCVVPLSCCRAFFNL